MVTTIQSLHSNRMTTMRNDNFIHEEESNLAVFYCVSGREKEVKWRFES